MAPTETQCLLEQERTRRSREEEGWKLLPEHPLLILPLFFHHLLSRSTGPKTPRQEAEMPAITSQRARVSLLRHAATHRNAIIKPDHTHAYTHTHAHTHAQVGSLLVLTSQGQTTRTPTRATTPPPRQRAAAAESRSVSPLCSRPLLAAQSWPGRLTNIWMGGAGGRGGGGGEGGGGRRGMNGLDSVRLPVRMLMVMMVAVMR